MANDYFRFKQFVVRQHLCAMKVGTDGTLLGAWANGGSCILDIGTGTGLILLMMAQRFPDADLLGVDIDADACRQASENVADSPFKATVTRANIININGAFDCIVSNPPYFNESLECPDAARTRARHTSLLSYRQLMDSASRLLTPDGEFSLVIPFDCKQRIEAEAALAGFFKNRECAVRTTPSKPPRRFLLAYRKHPVEMVEMTEGILETAPNVRSEWYHELTKDFYL